MKKTQTSSFYLLFVFFNFFAVPAEGKVSSWGKAKVERSTYDNDSKTCSLAVARRDVSADKEGKDYVRAFKVIDRENNQPPMPTPPGENFVQWRSERQILLKRMYNPSGHTDALQAKLSNEVESCLINKGYTRFWLSKNQEKQLRKYKVGSEARRSFLFNLATDPTILDTQKHNSTANK